MAIGHGFNKNARTKGYISAGKDARSGSAEIIVDLENAARRDLHPIFIVEV